ncbi:NACHT domain-containing protein [Skermanella rosea]|uniref:NACHT domain-containing protein n=1 Tax=Skermanella rosea TaxID=1817965 RepID=UPI00193481A1|nr:NACHT domain-containing protein [Skermanella rosea]UEM03753.1 NACHT domain-containing protein [Skermanella rosea]
MHDLVLGENCGNSTKLYEQIATSFEASMQYMFNDDALALAMRSLSNEILQRIDLVDEKISLALSLVDNGDPYENTINCLQRISKGLQSNYRTIQIETNKGSKPIDINKIYIPSKLRYRQLSETHMRLADIVLDKSRERGKILEETETEKHILFSKISYGDFRSSFRRVVVLGDPGGGKSTLCQYLCFELAKQCSLHFQYPDEKSKFESRNLKVPLRIVLRNFEAARLENVQLGLFEYLVNDIRKLITIAEDEAVNSLKYLLGYGRAILAFDGLDEILNTARRREFVQLVLNFCDEYPLCPVIVTSRLIGYEDAQLSNEFEELVLERFDEPEIRSYLSKFMQVVAGLKKQDALDHANDFLRQTEKNANDLRQNPLMLGLMSYLFTMKGNVPSNRPEIYKECAILMFEKWDQNRDIRAEIPPGFDMLHLFSDLASRIYGHANLEEGVDKDWIEKQNKSYFGDLFESRAKSNQAAKLVTKFVTERSWVMSEFSPDLYKFSHQTFLEYFFARNLDEIHETVEQLITALMPRIINREWDVISHLALQIKTFRNQKRIAIAVNLLKNSIQKALLERQDLSAVLLFSARALEYLPGSEADIKEICNLICSISFDAAVDKKDRLELDIINVASNCTQDRRDFARSTMGDFFAKQILGSTRPVSLAACAAITSGRDSTFPIGVLSKEVRLPHETTMKAKELVKPYLYDMALKDSSYAGFYWRWYNSDFEKFYEIHNVHMLIPIEIVLLDVDRMFDPVLSIPLALIYRQRNRLDHPNRFNDIVEALHTIHRCGIADHEVARISAKSKRSLYHHLPMEVWKRIFLICKNDDKLFGGVLNCFVYALRCGIITHDDLVSEISSRVSKTNIKKSYVATHMRQWLEAEVRKMEEYCGYQYTIYWEEETRILLDTPRDISTVYLAS